MIAGHGPIASLEGPDGKPRSGGARVSAPTPVEPADADRRTDSRAQSARHRHLHEHGRAPSRPSAPVRLGDLSDGLAAALARIARAGTQPGPFVLMLQQPVRPGDSDAERALAAGSATLAYRQQGALPPLYPQTPAVLRVRV
jgi:hypothetical protein